MHPRNTFLLGAVIFLFCLIGIQTVLIEQWLEMHEQRDRQVQIRQEILRLERLVAEVDIGFRGYVLTNQSTFLHPMVAAEASIPRIVEGLGQMTEAWPDLQGRIQVLNERVTELLDTKRRLTMEMTNGQEENVLRYIRGVEGLVLAHTIALAFQDLDQRVQQRQQEWTRDRAQTIRWVRWGFPVTAMGGVACGISIGRATSRARFSACAPDATESSGETGKSQEVRQRTLV